MYYKINNIFSHSDGSITVSTEQIKELIKNNPEILEDTKVSGRYFFPEIDKKYYGIAGDGFISASINDGMIDLKMIEMGVYKTQEEAELARDKQKATVACWKWAQENAPFEPDWENIRQNKYSVHYNGQLNKLGNLDIKIDLWIKMQFTLPYFKSQEDCEKFIDANKANLELLFTK